MIASFQVPETGAEHHSPMPEVPPPEALKNTTVLVNEAYLKLAREVISRERSRQAQAA